MVTDPPGAELVLAYLIALLKGFWGSGWVTPLALGNGGGGLHGPVPGKDGALHPFSSQT